MDKHYWKDFYTHKELLTSIHDPSSFAVFCQSAYLKDRAASIVELGCGNGRDATFLASQGHNVIALDQSPSVEHQEEFNNLLVLEADFIKYDYASLDMIDAFYSRFTLHSIKEKEELKLIQKVYNNLNTGGLFLIEARTISDPLCGVGEHICDTTYKTNHCRRFIDTSKFIQRCLDIGFVVKFFLESGDLSIVDGDNPVLMRIVLEKK